MAQLWTTSDTDVYGYISSETEGTLGEPYQINISLQQDYRWEINGYGHFDDADDSLITIASGYGGQTIYWTPPVSYAERKTTSRAIQFNLTCSIYDEYSRLNTMTLIVGFSIPYYPTISNFSITDNNNWFDVFGNYVQNESGLHLKAIANEASTYGVPITNTTFCLTQTNGISFKYIGEVTKNTDGSYVCTADVPLTVSGDVTISCTVTDTRSWSVNTAKTITSLSYTPPTISITTPYRCDSSGNSKYDGDYACVSLNATAIQLNNSNTLKARINYKPSDGTDAITSVGDYTAGSDLSIDNQIVIFPVNVDTEYIVVGECEDQINTVESLIKYVLKISPLIDIDRDNNAFGFGATAQESNTARFGPKVLFEKDAVVQGSATFEQPATFNELVTFNQGTNLPMYGYNYLDNSDFTNIVDQGICGSDFVFDRWHGNCTPIEIAGDSYRNAGIRIPSGGKIWQVIRIREYDNSKVNGTFGLNWRHKLNLDNIYTLAAMTADGTIHMITGKISDSPSSSVLKMYTSSYYLYIELYEGSYKWIALYEGEYNKGSLPIYHSKGYQEELQNCKKYCQMFNGYGFGCFYYSNASYYGSTRYEEAYTHLTCVLDYPINSDCTVSAMPSYFAFNTDSDNESDYKFTTDVESVLLNSVRGNRFELRVSNMLQAYSTSSAWYTSLMSYQFLVYATIQGLVLNATI